MGTVRCITRREEEEVEWRVRVHADALVEMVGS